MSSTSSATTAASCSSRGPCLSLGQRTVPVDRRRGCGSRDGRIRPSARLLRGLSARGCRHASATLGRRAADRRSRSTAARTTKKRERDRQPPRRSTRATTRPRFARATAAGSPFSATSVLRRTRKLRSSKLPETCLTDSRASRSISPTSWCCYEPCCMTEPLRTGASVDRLAETSRALIARRSTTCPGRHQQGDPGSPSRVTGGMGGVLAAVARRGLGRRTPRHAWSVVPHRRRSTRANLSGSPRARGHI